MNRPVARFVGIQGIKFLFFTVQITDHVYITILACSIDWVSGRTTLVAILIVLGWIRCLDIIVTAYILVGWRIIRNAVECS